MGHSDADILGVALLVDVTERTELFLYQLLEMVFACYQLVLHLLMAIGYALHHFFHFELHSFLYSFDLCELLRIHREVYLQRRNKLNLIIH